MDLIPGVSQTACSSLQVSLMYEVARKLKSMEGRRSRLASRHTRLAVVRSSENGKEHSCQQTEVNCI